MISVVVCTFNRAKKLDRCIKTFEKGAKDFQHCSELIIVDNNSSDDTKLVIQSFAKSESLKIKYVYEGRQGLSFARNTGVKEAIFPIIAFTDDDCLPARNWITLIYEEFRADPNLAILGGRVEPLESADREVGMRQFTRRTQVVSYDLVSKYMIGCNFAITRKVFDIVGPFDTGLGRGTKIDSGEDRDFFYRAFKGGIRIICSPDIRVYHGHGRHTGNAIQSCGNSYAQGRGAFYFKHIRMGDGVILQKALSEIWDLAKTSIYFRIANDKRARSWRILWHLIVGGFYQLRQGGR